MLSQDAMLQQALRSLEGKPAWGTVRTHGSMFFLEVGEPLPRSHLKKVHGEWHFLVELCCWRIETAAAILVGSDDEQEFIDERFAALQLGTIRSASVISPSYDLRIVFDSGIKLSTFSATPAPKEQWTEWNLYCPDENVWIVNSAAELLYKSVFV